MARIYWSGNLVIERRDVEGVVFLLDPGAVVGDSEVLRVEVCCSGKTLAKVMFIKPIILHSGPFHNRLKMLQIQVLNEVLREKISDWDSVGMYHPELFWEAMFQRVSRNQITAAEDFEISGMARFYIFWDMDPSGGSTDNFLEIATKTGLRSVSVTFICEDRKEVIKVAKTIVGHPTERFLMVFYAFGESARNSNKPLNNAIDDWEMINEQNLGMYL